MTNAPALVGSLNSGNRSIPDKAVNNTIVAVIPRKELYRVSAWKAGGARTAAPGTRYNEK